MRKAVIWWGCGLPMGFALVVWCCAGAERSVSHPLVCNSVTSSEHKMQQACNAFSETLCKEQGWCQAGWFQLSTCCVSHLPGHAM